MEIDSLYPLAGAEKGGEQAMVPFKAKMLTMAVCSWLRISTSYKNKCTQLTLLNTKLEHLVKDLEAIRLHVKNMFYMFFLCYL